MSTFVTLATRNDKSAQDVEYSFQKYDNGPVVCTNGSSELAHCLNRYDYAEITPELSKRLCELVQFLERRGEYPPEEELLANIQQWAMEHEGEKLHIIHQ